MLCIDISSLKYVCFKLIIQSSVPNVPERNDGKVPVTGKFRNDAPWNDVIFRTGAEWELELFKFFELDRKLERFKIWNFGTFKIRTFCLERRTYYLTLEILIALLNCFKSPKNQHKIFRLLSTKLQFSSSIVFYILVIIYLVHFMDSITLHSRKNPRDSPMSLFNPDLQIH